MSANLPGFEHRSALPWRCYNKNRKKLIFRILCPEDTESVCLVWGDPYDWRKSGNDTKWHCNETIMCRQRHVKDRDTWKIEIDPPEWKRLKYFFKIKLSSGVWMFSESGAEHYTEKTRNDSFSSYFVYPYIHEIDAPEIPEWAEKTIWYQIFPERFCKNSSCNALIPEKIDDWETGKPEYRNFFGGNLAGIREKLPYLVDLGITGIYLTPVFTSPSNHKYNIEDYYAIDPHFGDLNEMKALVNDAHALNIRVMLDAVFNHAGESHPFWQDVLQNQEKSPYVDYFHIRRFPVHPMQPPREMDFETFAWVWRMPKWNTENPAARKYLLDSAAYWIRECDIDGWRLDVANEVSFDFWQDFTKLVRSLKKDFYILGEMWHDASEWLRPGIFDAAMNYPLGFAISGCFLEKKLTPLLLTQRIFSVLDRYSDIHNSLSFNLLDSHDTERALTRAGGDKLALKNAFTMLFLMPGSPCVYYGTEIGMEGANDPDCRRPMVWNEKLQDADMLSFFKNLIEFRKNYLPIIKDSFLRYFEKDGVHYWEFSPIGKQAVYGLTAVYAESEKICGFIAPGKCVLGPHRDFRLYENGKLPLCSLVVYKWG